MKQPDIWVLYYSEVIGDPKGNHYSDEYPVMSGSKWECKAYVAQWNHFRSRWIARSGDQTLLFKSYQPQFRFGRTR